MLINRSIKHKILITLFLKLKDNTEIFLTQLQEESGAAGPPRADPRDGQVQRRLVVQLADLYLTLPWDINFMRNISK